jgi:uridine kinase
MATKVEEALARTYTGEAMPTVEDIQDVVENVLMEHRHTAIARDYIIYRHEHAMRRAARSLAFEVSDNIPYRIIYETLRWNMDHACDSVDALNRLIRAGRLPDLIRAADQRYAAETAAAADAILARRGAARIVIVAGPSSSGKTTTTIKIGEALRAAGLTFKAINVDHYFFDLERHPRDEFGDYDYETPEAIDLALIDRHLAELLAGRTIRTPHYDFKSGKRTLDVHELALAPNELLLIDSLHGLHDAMTGAIAPAAKFKVYIETLGQFRGRDGQFMRWADHRLLRRMVRDMQFRNSQPIETLTHWHYVRRSELNNIIPFVRNADYVVNSALPYELPFLKRRVYRLLAAARTRYRDDPRRLDAHIRANRVCDLLRPLKPANDDAPVPPTSLLREFIGGSAYAY